MSKELPYFQFEPAEYLASDISLCSLEAQGLFINIECLYWQKDCKLQLIQIERRFNRPKILQELIDEKIIKIKDGFILIDFLKQQQTALIKRKQRLSKAGRKGAAKRTENQQVIKPSLTQPLSKEEQTPKQLEEKRREEKRKEDNKKIEQRKADFFKSLTPFLDDFGKEVLREFFDYWSEHGEKDKKMRFEKEKSFGIKRRLATWKKNDKNWNKNENSTPANNRPK